jgi:hypothetical protein
MQRVRSKLQQPSGSLECSNPAERHPLPRDRCMTMLLPCDDVIVRVPDPLCFALVIGIDDYTHAPPLPNRVCAEGAASIAGVLRKAGFHVEAVLNATLEHLRGRITAFAQLLARAFSAQPGRRLQVVVHFCGHGAVYRGNQLLAAADSRLEGRF